jgi:hypothetical protein
MQRTISVHGDIDHVGPGIEIEVKWRGFVEHPVVHHDLCPFWLCLNAHDALAGAIAATEHFLKLSTRSFDFLCATQLRQVQVQCRRLPKLNIQAVAGFQIAITTNGDRVLAGLVEDDLCRRQLPRIPAIDDDCCSCRIA